MTKNNEGPLVIPQDGYIGREEREIKAGHRGHAIWLTGLSGSGKSTQARLLERSLYDRDIRTMVLDGDNVRRGLNGDLGFSADDRNENLRRVAHVARLMFDAGVVVICAFISPRKTQRDFARSLFPDGSFTEVFLHCSLEECAKRDPKGLYKKAFAGEIPSFTGVSAPYEEPEAADIILETGTDSEEVDAAILLRTILEKVKLN